MLMLISPAKKLDFSPIENTIKCTKPVFMYEAEVLVNILRDFSPTQIASLMKVSDQIATLNLARFADFSSKNTIKNAKPALFAFAGDTYSGLNAQDFDGKDLKFAQKHLRILSGLYGILRPLDELQAYRLEMGCNLKNPKGKDLYAYWRKTIGAHLGEILSVLETDIVVNLASQEYFKAVDSTMFNASIINCEFKDYHKGKYKIIGLYAKRARGAMARFIIKNKIINPKRLVEFGYDDYRFCESNSSPTKLVFLRG